MTKTKLKIFTRSSIVLLGTVLAALGLTWVLLKPGFDSEDIRHVILISIDTCRADYLSCYGYPQKTTRNIDAVAQEGILFRNVITSIPTTLPSHSSMMTGTIPPYHGIHNNGYTLEQSNVTLAEILRDNGFVTGAVISAFVMHKQFGLNQGFDTYNDSFKNPFGSLGITERKGRETNRIAMKWLTEHKDQRAFLFLHYFDPHQGYEPPEPFATEFQNNPYAGEISYVDYCIGQVVDKLKELSIYDSTLLIITSDHGEMLGEHGEGTHSYFIYQSAIKVPLIIKLPGKYKSRTVEELAGLVDITPTICGLLDIELPKRVQGKDLSAYLTEPSSSHQDRTIYCESFCPTIYGAAPLLGLVTNTWKYIQTTRPELYNLPEDPYESNDLIKQQPQMARILQDRLKQILEQTVSKKKSDSISALDQESRKQLESLGYVSSNKIVEDFQFTQDKKDPKDLIGFHALYAKIDPLVIREKYDQAMEICNLLVLQEPNFMPLYIKMGEISFKQDELEAAVKYFKKALSLDPNDPQIYKDLGTTIALQGKKEEAISYYKKSLEIRQDQPTTLDNLARIYSQQGKDEEAVNCWREALQFDPNNFDVLNNLGWVCAANKNKAFYNPTDAIRLAQKACELADFKNPTFLDTLAVAYAAAGEFTKAIEIAQKAVKLAQDAEQSQIADEIKKRLELYKMNKPYQEPPVSQN